MTGVFKVWQEISINLTDQADKNCLQEIKWEIFENPDPDKILYRIEAPNPLKLSLNELSHK
jgi:hypothetical protein